MKKAPVILKSIVVILLVVGLSILPGCTNQGGNKSVNQTEIDSLRSQITILTQDNEMITKNLITFDTLDYTVFTN